MKHSFILEINEISIDEISVLINILLDNRIKFRVLKSDNKVTKNKYEEVIDKAKELVNDPWCLESGNGKVDEIILQKKKELLNILNEVK